MKEFKDILLEGEKEYPVRIKTIVPITDKMYGDLERFVKKYRPIELGKVRKTIHQANPLDFGDLEGSEVYIVDAVFGLPVSSFVLQQELTWTWRLPEKQVVCRMAYEGMEQLSDVERAKDEIRDKAADKNLKRDSYLSTSSEYLDHETAVPQEIAAGEVYTDGFKEYLSKMAATRKDEVYPVNAGLFAFLQDNPQEIESAYANDFNKDIKGAPKVHPKWDKHTEAETDEEKARSQITSNWGNFWTTKTVTRPYKDYLEELEVALTTPELDKVRTKYMKGKKDA